MEMEEPGDGCQQASNKPSVVPQYVATITVNMISFTYGCSVGWASTALPVLRSADSPLATGAISEHHESWLAALICLLALVATPLFMALSTCLPRKAVGYVVATIYMASWLLLCCTDTLPMLYLSRVLVGAGAGGMLVLVPLYVSEIAEDSIRGTLGCVLLFFINIGILFAFIIGSYCSYYTSSFIYLSFPVMFVVAFFWLPETPFYLMSHNKPTEASASLQWLRGEKADISQELALLKASRQSTTRYDSKPSLFDLFSSKGTVRALTISVVLCMNQQLSGIFAILNYTVDIFEEAGSSLSPSTATIIVGILQLVGTYLSCVLVDRLGRRILLISSDIVVVVFLAIMGAYSYMKLMGGDVSGVTWLPLVCLSVVVVVFSVGLGPIPFVMMSEIFAPQIRGIATSVGYVTIWSIAFTVVKFFKPLSDLFGVYSCYWLFSISSMLGTIFIFFFVPETKGRSLEMILHELNGGHTRSKSRTNSEAV